MKKQIIWKDYLLMFLLLTMSANPYVGYNIEIFTIIGLLFIFIKYPYVLKIELNKEMFAILIVAFFISFEFIHRIIFGLENTKTIIRILGYYFFAYFSVKALRTKFIDTFNELIYILAIISLVFYVISLIPGINLIIYNFADQMFPLKAGFDSPTIIIYTFPSEYFQNSGNMPYLRNGGFTWEAGAFGVFLNLAIFFNIAKSKLSLIENLKNKKNIVMLIALLLTFSTTTYVVLSLYLIYFAFKERGVKKIVFVFILGLLIVFSFNNLEFLKSKIAFQLAGAEVSQNRFGSALLDLNDIKERPLLGWSRDTEVLFGNQADTFVSHRPNGLTNHIRNYGVISMFVLLILLFISFKRYFIFINKRYASTLAISVLLIILISSFSQLIFDKIFIKEFLFLSFVYSQNIYKKTQLIQPENTRI